MYSLPFLPWRLLFWAVMMTLLISVAAVGVKDAYFLYTTNHMARAMAIEGEGQIPVLAQKLIQQIAQAVPVDNGRFFLGNPPNPGSVRVRDLYVSVQPYDGQYVTVTSMYGMELPIAQRLMEILGIQNDRPIVFYARYSYYREW